MSIIQPFFYVLGGMLLGRFFPQAKALISKLLIRVFIPYVIVYNLLTYQPGTAEVAIFGFVFCILLYFLAGLIWRDRITALSFSYLNIGWLGLPLAIAVFGDEASRIIIAAYIGSSVFGNIASSTALQPEARWGISMVRALMAPPVLAVLAGLSLHLVPFDFSLEIMAVGYEAAKQLMSIAGMAVLGMWLYNSKVTFGDLRASIPVACLRALAGGAIVAGFLWISWRLGIDVVTENALVLFILPLLPPAANIVVLETYFRGTGESARLVASGTLISLGVITLILLVVPFL
ncbi:AEC family transporter [Halomonas salipaludis]|uniref:Permease n=1 Tax=Halomonas salipaludis TaxID=2032625 RepID=A0A2A2F0Z1_9GAMM|nr:permease [Halomonas salipaludis]PAU78299.1 permease [Halomonas salipaludis]